MGKFNRQPHTSFVKVYCWSNPANGIIFINDIYNESGWHTCCSSVMFVLIVVIRFFFVVVFLHYSALASVKFEQSHLFLTFRPDNVSQSFLEMIFNAFISGQLIRSQVHSGKLLFRYGLGDCCVSFRKRCFYLWYCQRSLLPSLSSIPAPLFFVFLFLFCYF